VKSRNQIFVFALFLAALNLRPGITSVSPILNEVSDVLGMNAVVASLLTSIPVLCMGIFSPIAARLGARMGTERILAGSMVMIALATVLRIFTHSSLYLLFTSFLLGIGIATAGPLLAGFIKHHFPTKVSSMIGLYSVAMVIGAAAGAGLTVPIRMWFDGSWRWALTMWAILALVAIPIWLFASRHPDASHNAASAPQHVPLPWKRGRAWVITIFFGLMAFLFYAFTAWLPPIAQSMGWSATFAGTVSTVFTLVQIPVTFILPLLTQKFPHRRFWLMLCSLSELIGVVLLLLPHVNPIVAAVFIGIGAGGLFPLSLLLPIDATTTASEASSWSAMAQSIGYIIGASGPIFVGMLHGAFNGFAAALGLLGVIVIAMLIIGFFITHRPESVLR
jgi:CP family cyanate transporter-like MFS transporter